jgi:hypothetical protein
MLWVKFAQPMPTGKSRLALAITLCFVFARKDMEEIMNRTIRKMWRLGMFSLVTLNLLLGVAAAQDEPTFTTIDFPGAVLTQTFDINAVGDVVEKV